MNSYNKLVDIINERTDLGGAPCSTYSEQVLKPSALPCWTTPSLLKLVHTTSWNLASRAFL
jgi:hypothetical protein